MKLAKNKKQKKLLKTINQSLDLLDQGLIKEQALVSNHTPIPSLLAQSMALCEVFGLPFCEDFLGLNDVFL